MMKGIADFMNYPFDSETFLDGTEFFVWPDSIGRSETDKIVGMFSVNVAHYEKMQTILDGVEQSSSVEIEDGSVSANACQRDLGAKIDKYLVEDSSMKGLRVESAAWLPYVTVDEPATPPPTPTRQSPTPTPR